MSLPRKDIRAFFSSDVHAVLVAICNARGISLADFIESIVTAEVKRITHEASVVTKAANACGIARDDAE